MAVLVDMGHTPQNKRKSTPKRWYSSGLEPNVFFFHWQITQAFAVQDEFTQKTQDLNPECKEGSIPMMQLGV